MNKPGMVPQLPGIEKPSCSLLIDKRILICDLTSVPKSLRM